MSASALGAALFRQHTAIMHSAMPANPSINAAAPPPATGTTTTTITANNSTTTTSSSSPSNSNPSCYGYHNTFHTHSQPADPNAQPPAYTPWQKAAHNPRVDALPSYSCSVLFEGPLGLKNEYTNIFEKPCGKERQWQDVYVVLRGTQLSIYRLKTHFFSKVKKPAPGRLLRTYSLQHAELGLALDFKKTDLIPKSPLAKLVPLNARQAVYQTDPHLFWPVREHVIRLRLETDQFLFCTAEQEGMLDWIEQLCAAVDISPPLDDRSEPRYRSLPRRGRRQRQLDGRQNRQETIDLNARRLLAEQERIIRTMYPNLAREEAADEQHVSAGGADADSDELDASDMLFPGRPMSRSANTSDNNTQNMDGTTDRTTVRCPSVDSQVGESLSSTSSKYPYGEHQEPSRSSVVRYRRRCAPVLLASSPRASDVMFCDGIRLRINAKKQQVTEFTEAAPHYSAHRFTASDREACLRKTTRPDVRREASNDSVAMSFHRDADHAELTPIASRSTQQRTDADDVESHQADLNAHDSAPPSPTTVQLSKVETETERNDRRLLDRVKGPLAGVAEAFGGLVI